MEEWESRINEVVVSRLKGASLNVDVSHFEDCLQEIELKWNTESPFLEANEIRDQSDGLLSDRDPSDNRSGNRASSQSGKKRVQIPPNNKILNTA